MLRNDSVQRLLPYQHMMNDRLQIRDEDLQVELTKGFFRGDKKTMRNPKIPFDRDIKKKESKPLAMYDSKLLQKMMKNASENYKLMMDIHSQLENAYNELKTYNKK